MFVNKSKTHSQPPPMNNSNRRKSSSFIFPLEIQERIISFCDVLTIYLLMQTCKHFDEICKKNEIWKLILQQAGLQNEAFSDFESCEIAASYEKGKNSLIDVVFEHSQQTVIIFDLEHIFLPFFICDRNVSFMKKHEPFYISQKFFIGKRNNSLFIYEFDSFFMNLLVSFPYLTNIHQWFGQLNDDYILIGNQRSFMVIETKGEIKIEEALTIQARSVIYDPSKRKVFYIQENKLNCMFLQGKEPITNSVEIPFKRVHSEILELKGLFVFIVVPKIAILIFNKSKLQFLKAVPIIYSGKITFLPSFICMEKGYAYNIFKDKFYDIEATSVSTQFPIREFLSKFNLPSINVINEDGEYCDDEDECIYWEF